MSDPAVPLTLGSRILTADGYAVVTDLERHGVRLRFSTGEDRSVTFTQLQARAVGDDGPQAVHASLFPWWPQLEEAVRRAVAAYRAIAEIFYAPFHWHKTDHGHAEDADGTEGAA